MAITDYRIIKDWEDGIADAVKAAIADGWQPIGEPQYDSNGTVRQVLIKGAYNTGVSQPASTTQAGAVKQAGAVADATDETDVVAQLNALLAGLRAAGVLEESAP